MIEPDRLNHAKAVVDKFLENNSDFTETEALKMNLCCKCGKELSEETKDSIWDYFSVIGGEGNKRIVPSVSCCGE